MYNFLFFLYRLYRYPYNIFLSKTSYWRNFVVHNLRPLSQNRIMGDKSTTFNQRTFVTGKGVVDFGVNCKFGYLLGGRYRNGSTEIQARTLDSKIEFGNSVTANNNLFICSSNIIRIGSKTLIGQDVTIMDFEAHGTSPDQRKHPGTIGTVEIGENVWIGNNVTILKNTTIGNNTIVAAGAIVTGAFPPNVIIGGIPAKVIRAL